MICNICLDKINLFYYKSKCSCKNYYHYECIEEWYTYNPCCITCKKKDNTNITIVKNILYEKILFIIYFILFLSFIFISLYF